ncbi:MAG: zinc ribbon domain-containing protein [Promethearchaeota archaeon]
MSQIHPGISQNLYEYADYMKKSLILAIILIFGSVFTILAAITESLGFVLIAGGIVGIVAIILLVFRIIMLIRLSRAKNFNRDPLLVQSFNLFIATIILSVISIFSSRIQILTTGINLVNGILTILAYKALLDYAIKNFSDVNDFEQGFKIYMIAAIISLGLGLIGGFIGFLDLAMGLMLSLIDLVLGITSIVGQFKMANAMMSIYSRGGGTGQFYSPTQPSSFSQFSGQSSTSFPQEPTFQSYGASSQPSATFRPGSEPNYNSETTKMNFCTTCGAPLPEGTKFCGSCGSKQ